MDSPDRLIHRPRRLRASAALRDAVADVTLRPQHLIYPLFVTGEAVATPVASMPGVEQLPVARAVELIAELRRRGLRQFLLFGVTPDARKDEEGSYARSPDAPVNQTLRAVRDAGLDVLLYADLCFCEYTSHGHCGVLRDAERGAKSVERPDTGHGTRDTGQTTGPGTRDTGQTTPDTGHGTRNTGQTTPDAGQTTVAVDNDRTLALLAKTAVMQAQCGADVVAPSGMMDGQVAAIRRALDEAGLIDTSILSYSVKFASSFYGPFREAGGGGMKFGDRCGYQMDYRRSREWRIELETDLAQGADMVMVKPAAAYLDIVQQVRQATSVPVAAYHVSGEYAMLHAAAQRGWLDLRAAAIETTTAIRRAGADLVITYFAPQLLEWLAADERG